LTNEEANDETFSPILWSRHD